MITLHLVLLTHPTVGLPKRGYKVCLFYVLKDVDLRLLLSGPSETQTISLVGTSGQTVEFAMSVAGTSANEFAIPCETTSVFAINL